MKKKFHWLTYVILLPFSLLYLLSCYLAKKVICPPVSPYTDFLSDELDRFKINSKETILDLKPELFFVPSEEGYPLRCRYYDFHRDKTIIMCHGWTANLCNFLKLIPMFLKLGYNILLYDQRYHGESGGKCTTFGYYEKRDLMKIIEWIANNKKPRQIGLYGCSMGASTIIQYLPHNSFVDFAIVDCPYSDLYEQFTNVLRVACPVIPKKIIISIADLFFRIKGKFSLKKIRPLKDMASIDIPILIVHGDKDFFVPTEMSRKLYQAKKDKKHLLIMPNADHGKAYDVNPRLYRKVIFQFLKAYKFV